MTAKIIPSIHYFANFAMALVCLAGLAIAQGPPHSQPLGGAPRRPSLSPYLNLGIENSGVLPSYQTFVLPQMAQNQQLINQFLMQAQTRRLEQTVTTTDPNLRQTGVGGKFQNRSHFYPATAPISRR